MIEESPLATSLTVLVLTYNEEKHIGRCLGSVQGLAERLVVVDSGSNDRTLEIAREYGATVLSHPWTTHAAQINWALDRLGDDTVWIMRLDADEYVDTVLKASLKRILVASPATTLAYEVRRPPVFLGRRLKHGGCVPWILRVWRSGAARCENRLMDEHMVLLAPGRIGRLPGFLVDENLNGLTWWMEKHNRYSSLAAAEALLSVSAPPGRVSRTVMCKRWVRQNVWDRLPLGLRAWFYLVYRLVLRLGILDGRNGILFHTLQGFVYRTLVDAKILQVRWLVSECGMTVEEAVQRALGIDPAALTAITGPK